MLKSKLYFIRKENKLRQADMAKVLNISEQSYLTSDKTLSDVRADDVVAEKSGFGSREQYRKAKFITTC